jgi:hypothetical protein
VAAVAVGTRYSQVYVRLMDSSQGVGVAGTRAVAAPGPPVRAAAGWMAGAARGGRTVSDPVWAEGVQDARGSSAPWQDPPQAPAAKGSGPEVPWE